jgi:hypothetical protein
MFQPLCGHPQGHYNTYKNQNHNCNLSYER